MRVFKSEHIVAEFCLYVIAFGFLSVCDFTIFYDFNFLKKIMKPHVNENLKVTSKTILPQCVLLIWHGRARSPWDRMLENESINGRN